MCMVEAMPYPTREWVERMLRSARMLARDEPREATRLLVVLLAALASRRDASMLVVAREALEEGVKASHLASLSRHYPSLSTRIMEALLTGGSVEELVEEVEALAAEEGLGERS